MNTVERSLRKSFRAVNGVFESPSAFGTDEDIAYWVNGKEIAHWDADGVVRLRLSRPEIGARRKALKADERVTALTTDWVRVRCGSRSDAAFVLELFEIAVTAHRAAPGQTPKPPPSSAKLESRRRFH